MKPISAARLYGIVDLGYVLPANVASAAAALIAGGADILQLRAKGVDPAVVKNLAPQIIRLCNEAATPFILNDYPELASELGADGVHIGQDDGEIYDVRSRITPGLIIGRSTHSLAQARQALAEGADYIGFGPLFPTPTKAGRPAIGLEDIFTMEQEVGSKIPAFCIGGIKPENLGEVLSAGAKRCVVVSHVLLAADIAEATRLLKASL